MTCPRCNTEMLEGKSFLRTGFESGGELNFKGEEWNKHVMLENSDVAVAHYCDGCGNLTLETGRCRLSTLESDSPPLLSFLAKVRKFMGI
ncbi:MAG: hypothetical protein EOP88_14095 [Verrucomicrobiaceae bacterium]|nr:MAG: hypothetical protein EOP88_14095 [Verrucomicrobiaceae bacterium]